MRTLKTTEIIKAVMEQPGAPTPAQPQGFDADEIFVSAPPLSDTTLAELKVLYRK